MQPGLLEEEWNNLRRRKTSRTLSFNSAVEKEKEINTILATLYSNLSNKDEANVIKTFEKLCLACCKKRMTLGGKRYDLETSSAKFLLRIVSQNKSLKEILKVSDAKEISEKVKNIISKTEKVGRHTQKTTAYKKGLNEMNQREEAILPQKKFGPGSFMS